MDIKDFLIDTDTIDYQKVTDYLTERDLWTSGEGRLRWLIETLINDNNTLIAHLQYVLRLNEDIWKVTENCWYGGDFSDLDRRTKFLQSAELLTTIYHYIQNKNLSK